MVDKITLLGNIILRYIKLCEIQCQYYRDKSDIKSVSTNLIIWFSNILALSVPEDGYSRYATCALNLISTFLLINKCD